MHGHASRVGVLAWSSSLLASGSRDRTILTQDVRVKSNAPSTPNTHGHASVSSGTSRSSPYYTPRSSLNMSQQASLGSSPLPPPGPLRSDLFDGMSLFNDDDGDDDELGLQTSQLSDDMLDVFTDAYFDDRSPEHAIDLSSQTDRIASSDSYNSYRPATRASLAPDRRPASRSSLGPPYSLASPMRHHLGRAASAGDVFTSSRLMERVSPLRNLG